MSRFASSSAPLPSTQTSVPVVSSSTAQGTLPLSKLFYWQHGPAGNYVSFIIAYSHQMDVKAWSFVSLLVVSTMNQTADSVQVDPCMFASDFIWSLERRTSLNTWVLAMQRAGGEATRYQNVGMPGGVWTNLDAGKGKCHPDFVNQ